MQGRGKTAAESRGGLGLARSAPGAGLSARLASGFCGVSGPPHPAPRPSQPLPAARNAKKRQVPRGWALARPLATQHPERCLRRAGSERLVLHVRPNRFLLQEPRISHPEVGFLARAASRDSNIEVPNPSLTLSPWECDFYSPFSSLDEKVCVELLGRNHSPPRPE